MRFTTRAVRTARDFLKIMKAWEPVVLQAFLFGMLVYELYHAISR